MRYFCFFFQAYIEVPVERCGEVLMSSESFPSIEKVVKLIKDCKLKGLPYGHVAITSMFEFTNKEDYYSFRGS